MDRDDFAEAMRLRTLGVSYTDISRSLKVRRRELIQALTGLDLRPLPERLPQSATRGPYFSGQRGVGSLGAADFRSAFARQHR